MITKINNNIGKHSLNECQILYIDYKNKTEGLSDHKEKK